MFGKQGDHVEVSLNKDGAQTAGIAFFSTPDSFQKPLAVGEKVDVVGHVELDWRGGPRIRIVDII
jgi:hypothetical protein